MFVPTVKPGKELELRTCSSRRARLWAGGTYFRAREPGQAGNLLMVEVFEYSPAEAYCRVTNLINKYSENIFGAEHEVKFFEYSNPVQGEFQDLYEIYNLNSTPLIRLYSISYRIRFSQEQGTPVVLPAPTELGPFKFDKLFVSGKLSVQLTKKTSNYAPGDVIFIAPRVKTFALSPLSVAPPPDLEGGSSEPEVGFNITELRSQMNAANIWVEMKERSGTVDDGLGGTVPVEPLIDAQDKLQDAKVLKAFTVKNLENGDGLPDNPDRENTGPTKSIVHVNYGELEDGSLGELARVFEWVGDTSTAGSWKMV